MFVRLILTLSLLLFGAAAFMWAASYKYFDMVHTTRPGHLFDVESCRGEVQFALVFDHHGGFDPGRRTQLWTRELRDGNYLSRSMTASHESAYDFIFLGVGGGWNQVPANSPNLHHYRLLLPYWLLVAVFGIFPLIRLVDGVFGSSVKK